MDFLKNLCEAPGISGCEDAVRGRIENAIRGYASFQTDALGNLLVHKKGAARANKRVLLAAHMDEVGMIVTHIEENGLLRFATVGGIPVEALFGSRVRVGKGGIPGVIASKPIHMLKGDEREKLPEISELAIDIGALTKEEASGHVRVADAAVWDTVFEPFGSNFIKAKALDDRAGCALLVRLIQSDLPYDLDIAFTVQEEVGLHGAKTAAYAMDPEFALVVETTTAADIAGVDSRKQVCVLGKGPAVSFMDLRTAYDRKLYTMAFDAARHIGVPCQPKSAVAGGNDAGAIHLSRAGVRTLALSIPCRYLHSPAGIIARSDYEHTFALLNECAARLAAGDV